LKILRSVGREDLARVYLAEIREGRYVEFVESLQSGVERSEKWVLIVSTLFGCPIGCAMCDAGGRYLGPLTPDEILGQIRHMICRRFPDRIVPVKKFKIQFARMGEPALNPAVLDVLERLPVEYNAPGLMPSVSSVAPAGCEGFFERLLRIKRKMYSGGRFQLQFSIHSTDPVLRDAIVPVKKWGLAEIASYGNTFFEPGDRKVTLNSALAEGAPLDAGVLAQRFDPDKFLIKITPVNPTYEARRSGIKSHIVVDRDEADYEIVRDLRQAGFEVLVSIGAPEENLIGSNCGQYVRKHLSESQPMDDSYICEREIGDVSPNSCPDACP